MFSQYNPKELPPWNFKPDKDPDRLLSERYENDTKHRGYLTKATMQIIRLWLLAVFLIILCVGSGKLRLSDTVLCTILGTTTANILGLAFIVLRGFFHEMNQNVKLGRREKGNKADPNEDSDKQ